MIEQLNLSKTIRIMMKKFDYNQSISNIESFEEINNLISEMLSIDEENLDGSALEQPKIFSFLQRLYAIHSRKLSKLMTDQKKVDLFRWKYYNEKLPSEYYTKKEPLREKVLKTDVDKYLKTDDLVVEAKNQVEEQDRIVNLIESAQKVMASRGFDIKNAIEYRKFLLGG